MYPFVTSSLCAVKMCVCFCVCVCVCVSLQLFVEKEKAEEMWLARLVSMRQERLMGSPVP